MNSAEKMSCEVIERTIGNNRAYRKVDEKMYVIKQGSSYVMINVVPLGTDRAIVRCVAQLVKGVRMDQDLSVQLLSLNAVLRFGAFGFVKEGNLVLFLHSILGGETLDSEELLATIRDVALIADDWDDKIIERFGGQTMQDLLEETAVAKVLSSEPDAFSWDQ
ncbi:MAG: hypothetical protein V1754_12915 [Pseudomonadota bacterium]